MLVVFLPDTPIVLFRLTGASSNREKSGKILEAGFRPVSAVSIEDLTPLVTIVYVEINADAHANMIQPGNRIDPRQSVHSLAGVLLFA